MVQDFTRPAIRGILLFAALLPLLAVDPTFLRRHVPQVEPKASPWTAQGTRYRPVFGEGDTDARQLRGVTRFAELALDPGANGMVVTRPGEEQIWVLLRGAVTIRYADSSAAARPFDYWYVPPGVAHAVDNPGQGEARLLVMGFRVPAASTGPAPAGLLKANLEDVPLQTVGSHPPSTQYRLLLGDTTSKRDRLACARVVTSLFVMEFAPGGTNIPHHHETEEEIYYVLDGFGQMVAGGGLDGLEGKLDTRAGDAWFFRLNTTVGFYSPTDPAQPKARILAVRSRFPFSRP